MKVLVCGGRFFTDREAVFKQLCKLHKERPISSIIEGGQRTFDGDTGAWIGGADYWARRFAENQLIECRTHYADWDAHGKAAGPIRNQHMLDEEKPDLVVAFPGGKGTADMVRKAKAAGVKVIEVKERTP